MACHRTAAANPSVFVMVGLRFLARVRDTHPYGRLTAVVSVLARPEAGAILRGMKRILVTGAAGQVGSELVPELRRIYGEDAVLATDVRADDEAEGPYEVLDCTDAEAIAEAVRRHRADTVYHLAALLSATAEAKPLK